ncbi:MAG: hypothetical protein AAFP28_04425 [Pseudomonadota bacterium]
MLSGLVALDQIAAQKGDGLNPKLRELLTRGRSHEAQGAVTLPTVQASAGPAEQRATPEELEAAGIPILATVTAPVATKKAAP